MLQPFCQNFKKSSKKSCQSRLLRPYRGLTAGKPAKNGFFGPAVAGGASDPAIKGQLTAASG